jgi:hypothetical protein
MMLDIGRLLWLQSTPHWTLREAFCSTAVEIKCNAFGLRVMKSTYRRRNPIEQLFPEPTRQVDPSTCRPEPAATALRARWRSGH